jgi:hypothetical protein
MQILQVITITHRWTLCDVTGLPVVVRPRRTILIISTFKCRSHVAANLSRSVSHLENTVGKFHITWKWQRRHGLADKAQLLCNTESKPPRYIRVLVPTASHDPKLRIKTSIYGRQPTRGGTHRKKSARYNMLQQAPDLRALTDTVMKLWAS